MPQFGVLVYAPAPTDPLALSVGYLERIDAYPAQAKALGGKVLGGSYFSKERGFAFGPSESTMSIAGDTTRTGPLAESDLVIAAFFILSAPDLDTAVRAAQAHPAAQGGGLEVRPMFESSAT